MISHFEHLVRAEGCAWNLATALRGAGERLVPILMTALVTALLGFRSHEATHRPGRPGRVADEALFAGRRGPGRWLAKRGRAGRTRHRLHAIRHPAHGPLGVPLPPPMRYETGEESRNEPTRDFVPRATDFSTPKRDRKTCASSSPPRCRAACRCKGFKTSRPRVSGLAGVGTLLVKV
ncbi:MAG: AcrB/AcrD/AcrF family protein, partial [Chthoniobacter sp.]|nr:AcrB/AcrD/AcrF family protein [Chthoniobacter sp.]